MDSVKTYIENKLSFNVSEFVFTDYPMFVSRDTYVECRSLVINELSKIDGVRSVYSMGNVSAPGISDLDFFIIIEPEFKNKKAIVKLFNDLSEENKYLAYCHYPYIAFSDSVLNTLQILPLSNMHHEYGDNYNLEKHSYSDEDYIMILRELITLFYPNLFLEPLLSKKLPVRNLIQKLNGLSFPIEFANRLGFDSAEIEVFLKLLSEVKKDAFNEDIDKFNEKLISLLKLGLVISYQLIDFIDSQSNFSKKVKNSYSVYLNTFFTNNYSSLKAISFAVKMYKKLNFLPKLLPVSYSVTWFNTFNFLESKQIPNSLKLEMLDSRRKIYMDYLAKIQATNLKDIIPYPFVYRLFVKVSLVKKIIFKLISIFL